MITTYNLSSIWRREKNAVEAVFQQTRADEKNQPKDSRNSARTRLGKYIAHHTWIHYNRINENLKQKETYKKWSEEQKLDTLYYLQSNSTKCESWLLNRHDEKQKTKKGHF